MNPTIITRFISPKWLSAEYIRRVFLLVAPVVLIASVYSAVLPQSSQALLQPSLQNSNELSFQNSRMMENVDLFTLIRTTGTTQKLYSLSTRDRALYQRIFEAQTKEDWLRANALMKRLSNRILVGHVLYERYIRSAGYHASYSELRAWMVNYGDHPDAYRVYQLAQKRRQNDPSVLPAPQVAKKLLGSLELAWLKKDIKQSSLSYKPKRNEAAVRQLMGQVKHYLAIDAVTRAYDALGKSPAAKTLSAIEYDSLQGEIAAGYYYNRKYDVALSIAQKATARSHEAAPMAAWIGGLAAWQLNNYEAAAKQFELVTHSHSRSPWMLSAGAFWAARAYDRLGNDSKANALLREASAYPRTFYGLIAQSKMGQDVSFSWDSPSFSNGMSRILAEQPAGARALALLDVGQKELATKELKQIHPENNERLEQALVAAANQFGLASLALQLGNAVNQPDGTLYDVALYPMVPWKGDETAAIDPALINALIRQESKFDPEAQNSRSGATGLMQLMPRTAKFVSDKSYDVRDMQKPEVNIALGQRYVRYLLDMPRVDGNLLYLATAYNAGPGNLARWQKNIDHKNDPYLFIESIPLSETRTYVERVMTNYWIYSQRMDQDNESLHQLTKDSWPIYKTQDAVKMASY